MARVRDDRSRLEPHGVQRCRHDEIGGERGDTLEVDVLETADSRHGTQLRRQFRMLFDADEIPVRPDAGAAS